MCVAGVEVGCWISLSGQKKKRGGGHKKQGNRMENKNP